MLFRSNENREGILRSRIPEFRRGTSDPKGEKLADREDTHSSAKKSELLKASAARAAGGKHAGEGDRAGGTKTPQRPTRSGQKVVVIIASATAFPWEQRGTYVTRQTTGRARPEERHGRKK